MSGAYEFEGVALDLDGSPRWRSHTVLDWTGPFQIKGRIGARSYNLPPVCANSVVMIRMSRTSAEAPAKAPLAEAYFEFRNGNGDLLSRGWTDPDDPTLEGGAIGAGDLWLFNDATSDKPRVRIYSLQPRAAVGGELGVASILAETKASAGIGNQP